MKHFRPPPPDNRYQALHHAKSLRNTVILEAKFNFHQLSEIPIFIEKQLFYCRALSRASIPIRQIRSLGPLMASMHEWFHNLPL